jgi:hypothetical protein
MFHCITMVIQLMQLVTMSIVLPIDREIISVKHNSSQLSTAFIPVHTLSTPTELHCFDTLLLLDMLQVWQCEKFKLIQLNFHLKFFLHVIISILHLSWADQIYTPNSEVYAQNTLTSKSSTCSKVSQSK